MAVKILADLWLLIALLVHVATIAVAIASLAGKDFPLILLNRLRIFRRVL